MVRQAIVAADTSAALVRLNGISVIERLLRTLDRCGIETATIVIGRDEQIGAGLRGSGRHRPRLKVVVRHGSGSLTSAVIAELWPKDVDSVLFTRGDMVFDPRLLQQLLGCAQTTVLVDGAVPDRLRPLTGDAADTVKGQFCGAALITREWFHDRAGGAAQELPFSQLLVDSVNNELCDALDVATLPTYSGELRREMRPFWFPAPTAETQTTAEKIVIRAAQKGSQDLPALIHAPLENCLVRQLAQWPITPNQLSVVTNVVAWTATLLFVTGHLYFGLALAVIVGVLDGLDGKQARVKVETSAGGKLEHWFDGAFEWSWWAALTWHFRSTAELPAAVSYLLLLVAAELVDAVAKGMVLFRCGRLIDEIAPFDRFVRLFGGRRNIYVWILVIGALLGIPARAFVIMAWWEAATAAVHVPRAVWILWRGGCGR
jgi:phosphatidylglycerophosphate synthase